MIHSEEKRIAEEIINDLKDDDKWNITYRCNSYSEIEVSGGKIRLRMYGLYLPFRRVNMYYPIDFKFSYSFSYKMSKLIKRCIKSLIKKDEEVRRGEAMEEFKGLYINPKDGNLYIRDKKQIK